MSVLTARGGVPRVIRASIDGTGREVIFPFTCQYLKIRTASKAARMYFKEVDWTADANYVEVATGTLYWEGPAEVDRVWLKRDAAAGAAAVEIIAFQRRG